MVMSHSSFNSSSDLSAMACQIFPEIEMAKLFIIWCKSAAHLCFDLCPYFKEQLVEDIKKSSAMFFDERLNKATHKTEGCYCGILE